MVKQLTCTTIRLCQNRSIDTKSKSFPVIMANINESETPPTIPIHMESILFRLLSLRKQMQMLVTDTTVSTIPSKE